jgi:hypothetical protein
VMCTLCSGLCKDSRIAQMAAMGRIGDFFAEKVPLQRSHQKVLTYVEYRAESGVFQILTPSAPSECVLPPHQRGGVHTRRAVRGWGVNILEDARHWIGLSQYNPSTVHTISSPVHTGTRYMSASHHTGF